MIIDLDEESSPYSGNLNDESDDYTLSCGSLPEGKEVTFRIMVQPKQTLNIRQNYNMFDSMHQLSYGEKCPGTIVACVDDPVTYQFFFFFILWLTG